MTYIYVLKLEQGKYYCGKTNDIDVRMTQHCNGFGSSWTKKYKPIEIMYVYASTSCFDEDKTTKELMMKYGIQNVRGGSYITEYLPKEKETLLQKEIWASNDCCNRCGKKGHFMNTCRKRKDIHGNVIVMKMIAKKGEKICKRCGRSGHNKQDCYAKTKFDGTTIVDRKCSNCGNTGHTKKDCKVTI